jgi:site-specific DNA recombinase
VTINFGFYGRVSTEENQDMELSRAWQLDLAQQLIAPHGGVVVEEFFDLGVSRSIPWQGRREAARLLRTLADPRRGFSDVVLGANDRGFSGAQHEGVLAQFQHYGVRLWSPSVGGPIDPANIGHDAMMGISGIMSKAERAATQKRVKDAMWARAKQDTGRHLGGRPPYGYLLADAGPHPNPSKAADGKRSHRLAPDPITGPVVGQIFDMYAAGYGLGAIAQRLVAQGHPSPSAHDRERNRHRSARGWATSAIRAILKNERYTGVEIFGKQPRRYELVDPENPSWGHRRTQDWAAPETWFRSAELVHPALVTQDVYDDVQSRFAANARPDVTRDRRSKHEYLLRGRLVCGICLRVMQGSRNNDRSHYRCRLTSDYVLPAQDSHPKNVYLAEGHLTEALDRWIATAFLPENLESTIRALSSASADTEGQSVRKDLHATIQACDRRLARVKEALDGDGDIHAVTEWIKQTERERIQAQTDLKRLERVTGHNPDSVAQMLAIIPDISQAIHAAATADKKALYEALDLRLTYQVHEGVVDVEATPTALWGNRACPRGDLNPHALLGH